MTVNGDVWSCEQCGVTERLDVFGDGPAELDRARRLAQLGHGRRHEAERGSAQPITAALLEATEMIAGFRVRLVVAPGDHERVRELVKRRGVPIEVFAGQVPLGRGYVMQPRRGVRELHPSTPGDNPGDTP